MILQVNYYNKICGPVGLRTATKAETWTSRFENSNKSRNIPALPELVQQPEQRNFRLCLLLIRLQKGCARHIYQQVSSLFCTLFSGMLYLLYPSYEEDNEGHHHGGVGQQSSQLDISSEHWKSFRERSIKFFSII